MAIAITSLSSILKSSSTITLEIPFHQRNKCNDNDNYIDNDNDNDNYIDNDNDNDNERVPGRLSMLLVPANTLTLL